jgi:hypothetical protein
VWHFDKKVCFYFSNFLKIEMYVRGNGRDLTTSFYDDPNFVSRTVDMVLSNDNGTIVASFIQSGRWKTVTSITYYMNKRYKYQYMICIVWIDNRPIREGESFDGNFILRIM